jgi:hypothetical protein
MSSLKFAIKRLKEQLPHAYFNIPLFPDLKAGDYGVYEQYHFIKHGNIFQLLNMDEKEGTSRTNIQTEISASSDSLKSIVFTQANAIDSKLPSLDVVLSRGSSCYFKAKFKYKEDLYQYKTEIERKWLNFRKKDSQKDIERQQWDDKYCVVGGIYIARNAFVIISNSNIHQASVKFGCKSPEPLTQDNFGSVDLGLNILSQAHTQMVAQTSDPAEDRVICIELSKFSDKGLDGPMKGIDQNNDIPYRINYENYTLNYLESDC